ncbi:MAG: hypothetical protein FVQ84_04500 [Planctomycetes bacterium]|nr:hypothetical protein [Planctomycetota bacterium]
MTKEIDFKKEQLKHIYDSTDKNSNNVKMVQDILTKVALRVRHMKRIIIFAWITFALLFIFGSLVLHFMHVEGSALNPSVVVPSFRDTEFTRSLIPASQLLRNTTGETWAPLIAVTLRLLLVIVSVLTIFLYIRSKTLSMRKVYI